MGIYVCIVIGLHWMWWGKVRHGMGCDETYGGDLLSLIPTASSSASRSARCSAFLVASRIINIMSLVFAALMTCRPLPLPSAAPSMIPGKSKIWISAPPYSSTPGMAVRVVKE